MSSWWSLVGGLRSSLYCFQGWLCLEGSIGFSGISFTRFCLPPGSGLSDGQWHSVSLSLKGNHLTVMVDGEAATVAHSLRGRIDSGDTYHWGGKWKELALLVSKPFLSFQLLTFKTTDNFKWRLILKNDLSLSAIVNENVEQTKTIHF